VDEVGCFSVDPIPDSPFRLRCHTVDGTDVLTGWITILGTFGSARFFAEYVSNRTQGPP
jgi:hypothetical protein